MHVHCSCRWFIILNKIIYFTPPIMGLQQKIIQMYNTWIDAFEDDEISAVILLDMSADFDVVDHDILLDKLALDGLESGALS